MLAPTPHRPSPAGDTPDHDDLDTRIRRAELDLIARDQRVRARLATLGGRVQRARQPARWAVPVAGGAALLLAGWWLSRRVRRRGAAQARSDEAAPRRRGVRAAGAGAGGLGGGLGLLQMLTLAWPLLPEAWRARWGPTWTAALLNLGSLLGGRLAKSLFDRDGPARAPRGRQPPD